MKNLCFFIFISLLSNNLIAQTSDFTFLEGKWVGQGYQLNTNETWSIILTIKDDFINVDYPSLGCKSNLTATKCEGNSIFLNEKLLPKSSCVDNGKIELEWTSPNELIFKWSLSDGEPGSFARLYKF